MMLDGKGCALIVALISIAGLLVGLVVHWVFGVPRAPLYGLAVGPGVLIAFVILMAVQALVEKVRKP